MHAVIVIIINTCILVKKLTVRLRCFQTCKGPMKSLWIESNSLSVQMLKIDNKKTVLSIIQYDDKTWDCGLCQGGVNS